MAANLEDVPSLDLMHELLRRMKCSSKPDKRLILIGKGDPSPCPFFLLVAGVRWIPVSVPGAAGTEKSLLAAVGALDPPKVFGPVWFVANYATLCLRLVVRIEELTLGT
jgi:hypothetical protein